MTNALRQRLLATIENDPPRSKSLLVTVFGDSVAPHGGIVMLKGLIKLIAPFSISPRLVRTSVHRLQVDGWLMSKREGRFSAYSLTPDGVRRFMNAYKRIYASPSRIWDESWTVVFCESEAIPHEARKILYRDLAWEGFGVFSAGVFVNPRANLEALRDIISASRASIFVLTGRNLEQISCRSIHDFVRDCWDLDSVASGYESFLARFEPIAEVAEEFNQIAPRDAFVLRTVLIHYLRRVALHDPLLPAELLPKDWPGHRAYELCRVIYRRAYRKAEAFLHESLETPDRSFPEAAPYFHERFGGLD
jgi:phenylacetic acid degradation operon negative regulatory protein